MSNEVRQEVRQEVETTVETFVKEEKMFTSFEVVQAIRKRKKNWFKPYRQVREEVCDLFLSSKLDDDGIFFGYERTLLTVVGDKDIFVYHKKGQDPQEHPLFIGKPQLILQFDKGDTVKEGKDTISKPQQLSKDIIDTEEKVIKTTSDGRLRIPFHFIQSINVCNKDSIFCYQDNNDLVISSTPVPNSTQFTFTSGLKFSKSFVKNIFKQSSLFKIDINNVPSSKEKRLRVSSYNKL
jgi:hypothetical protein